MLSNRDLAFEAMCWAHELHATQVRRYTNNPYVDHLAEVAGYAAVSVPKTFVTVATAVAWLHDAREDQGVSHEELVERFGHLVARGVGLLSDFETGVRATRKALARTRLSQAPGWIQTIKVSDGLSNYSSICQHDPKFAKVYQIEMLALAEVLTKANSRLKKHVVATIATAYFIGSKCLIKKDLKPILPLRTAA